MHVFCLSKLTSPLLTQYFALSSFSPSSEALHCRCCYTGHVRSGKLIFGFLFCTLASGAQLLSTGMIEGNLFSRLTVEANKELFENPQQLRPTLALGKGGKWDGTVI